MYKAPLKGDTSVTKAILPGGLTISGEATGGLTEVGSVELLLESRHAVPKSWSATANAAQRNRPSGVVCVMGHTLTSATQTPLRDRSRPSQSFFVLLSVRAHRDTSGA